MPHITSFYHCMLAHNGVEYPLTYNIFYPCATLTLESELMPTKFNISFINNLKPKDTRYEIRDALLNNLTIRVSPTGQKVYYMLYRALNGTHKRLKLGDAAYLQLADAREIVQKKLTDLAREGVDPATKPGAGMPTLEELLKINESAGGSKYCRDIVRRYFPDQLGLRLNNIQLLDIETSRQSWLDSTRITNATANKRITALKAILNWALHPRTSFKDNPIRGIKKLKEIDSKTIVRYLSVKERERLYAALEGKNGHLKYMIIVSLNTGIRQGALFALKWDDINFKDKTITLRATSAKSRKTTIIPINQAVIDALLIWREISPKNGPLVFPSPRGGGELDNVKKAWTAILKQANIKNFRWHDMRHDFASRLVMAGVDLNTVRELLGHSDLKMTMRYAHLAPEAKRSAVDLLN